MRRSAPVNRAATRCRRQPPRAPCEEVRIIPAANYGVNIACCGLVRDHDHRTGRWRYAAEWSAARTFQGIMLMDMKLAGGVMDAVNEGQNLVRAPRV